MRALVYQPSRIQDGDPVGELERRAAVRDQQRGAPGHHLAQGRVDLRLDPRIDGGGGVVQHEDRRVGDQRPGQRHPLALAAGQGEALLADDGAVAVRQAGDELVGFRRPGRRDDLLRRRIGPAVGDVGADRVGEQEAVLHHQADRGPQRLQGQVADIPAADPDHAAPDVIEARQQQGDRRLARSGRADHRERLARPHVQGQAPKHRRRRQVAEGDAVQLHVGRPGRQVRRTGLLGDHRLCVDHLVDPDHAGPRLLADRDQGGQRAHGRDHLPDVEREGEEDPDLDRAVQGQPAAQREDRDLAEHGDGRQRGVVTGGQPDDTDAGRVQPRGDTLQPVGLLLLLTEALDHAHAGHRAVDDARDLRLLLLRVPAGGEEPAPRGDRYQPERGRDRQCHHGEQR